MASSCTSLFLSPLSSATAAHQLPLLGGLHRGSLAPPAASSIRCRPAPISASCASTAERPRTRTTTLGGGLASSLSSSSLYEVLGIRNGATCQEIKSAYRRLARMLHPDAVIAATEGQRDVTGREFMRVHEAYATLSDPDKRADYDRTLLARRTASSSSAAAAAPFVAVYSPRRKWETDQCW